MNIIYSYNKKGTEAAHWEREIRECSNDQFQFIPFNHGEYLYYDLYRDAVLLDRLYQSSDERLLRMYRDLEEWIRTHRADAIFVTNCPPYHPEFFRKLHIYKALYTTDDPGATYMRTIPYLHSYDHVFHSNVPYSKDMDYAEKMRYCGVRNINWLPLSVFEYEYDGSKNEGNILSRDRDIEIVYVGGFFPQKLELLAGLKHAFGKKFRQYGLFRTKHNLYLNFKYRYGGWIRPVSYEDRVKLYQRSKIGINIHWNRYGLGNQRLYHLPANGVMQICDCASRVGSTFAVGEEIVSYESLDDLVEKIRYYLANESARTEIARRGYERTMRDYKFRDNSRKAAKLILEGMRHSAGAEIRYRS